MAHLNSILSDPYLNTTFSLYIASTLKSPTDWPFLTKNVFPALVSSIITSGASDQDIPTSLRVLVASAALLEIIDVEPGLPDERTGYEPERDDKVIIGHPFSDFYHGRVLACLVGIGTCILG